MHTTRCPFCSEPGTLYCRIDIYVYYRCPSCLSLYLHPVPSAHELKSYYERIFTYGEGADERMRRRARITVKRLQWLHPTGTTLLDIGSGKGWLLEESARYGIDAEGIEPSSALYAETKRKRLRVHHTDLQRFRTDRTYDFVTMVHVIEHLSDPIRAIHHAKRLLRHNGILYIETPNSNGWLSRAERERYTFLTPPDHLWLFSEQSLKAISTPMIPMKCYTYSYPEHFVGVLKAMIPKRTINMSPAVSPGTQMQQAAPRRRLLSYLLVNKLLAPILYRLLNIGNNGTVLELYLKKNR